MDNLHQSVNLMVIFIRTAVNGRVTEFIRTSLNNVRQTASKTKVQTPFRQTAWR
jgi:hypothetical protein